MTKNRNRALAALAAAGALVALPVAATASPVSAAEKVGQHTDRADDALAKAGTLFQAGKDQQALKSLNRSRAELGKATAAAAKLLRNADTGAERAEAAKALRLVATQRDENVPELAKMLGEADVPGAEQEIAKAALADVTGREKAISVLQGLIAKGMPDKAEIAITKAIARLSTDRQDEVSEATESVSEGDVSPEAAKIITKAIDKSLRGQARASATITALLETAPEAAKKGLQRALEAISKEQKSAATGLEHVSAHMPESVRAMVDGMIRRAESAGRPTEGPGADAGETPGVPAGVTVPSVPVDLSDPGKPASVPSGPPAGVGGAHVTPPAGPLS